MTILPISSSTLLNGSSDQRESSHYVPKLFINCSDCDIDYIRDEIPFIDYVRYGWDADIYLQILSYETSGGGREYLLEFTGKGIFLNCDETCLFPL